MKNETVTVETLAPQILPLETIDALKNWASLKDPANIAKINLAPRVDKSPAPIPSLIGFDNGEFAYDPWFTQWSQGAAGTGAEGNRTAANVYNFSFWQYVDISYYYTHCLLTIPPTVWTNACHKNGVLSLGTLNLNWSENKGLFTVEEVEYLLTRKNAGSPPGHFYLDDAIQCLIDVSQYYGFDGYLVNVEAALPGKVDGMLDLLSSLKAANCRMVWYDSPFSGGYANRLNQAAYKFLQAGTDFQSNYWWNGNEGAPKASYDVLVANKAPKDERNHVFMGKYCSKEGGTPPYGNSEFFDAMNSIKSQGNPPNYYTGLNVYYPAWVMFDMRTHPTGRNTDKLPNREDFHANDQAFWTGTKESIIFPDKKVPITADQCMKTYIEERSAITSLPFVTYFNDGEGDFYNIDGAPASTEPWNNLSDQSILPTYRFFFNYPNSRKNKTAIVHPSSEFVYTGGSSLAVDFDGQTDLTFPLFKTGIVLPPKSQLQFIRKQNNLASETPILQIDGVGSVKLAQTQKNDLPNGWKQLIYDVPAQYAGKTVTRILLQLVRAGTTDSSYYLSQFGFLDTTGTPSSSRVFTFEANEDELVWKMNPTSHYRVYGTTAQNQTYLIGIVYNSVYRVRYGNIEANHIFNSQVKSFVSYQVVEVDSSGIRAVLS